MGIRSLKLASISTGVKRSKVWDQSAVINNNSFESIATTTLSSSQTGITFSSIPSTYKHLQLRMLLRADRTNGDDLKVQFNGDTGNNYAVHVLGADGANTSPYGQSSFGFIYSYQGIPGVGTTTGLFYSGVMDIVDYQNTNKNTTIKWLQGYDNNGGGNVQLTSGLWSNTAAVNSISIAPRYGTNFVQYSQIALYGIKG
jgi:hypothetical protein